MATSVTISRSRECRSWVSAVRVTIAQTSPSAVQHLRLQVASLSPSQIRPPPGRRLIARASATSSISSPRIASIPPAARNACRRTNMQPPAAAATREAGSLAAGNGYSFWKKKTKGGIRSRSQKLAQRSRTISETRSSRSASALATRRARLSGGGDVGVGQQDIGRSRRQLLGAPKAARHRPELTRPTGRQSGRFDHLEMPRCHDRQPFGNRPRTILTVIVDQNDRERAAIVLPEERSQGGLDGARLVPRRYHRNHIGPGTLHRPPLELEPRPGAPEAVPTKQQIEPNQERQTDQGRILCSTGSSVMPIC